MFNQSSPFFKRSRIIAEEFLQTTVIVDDQAYFGDEKSILEIRPPTPIDLKPPGRGSGRTSDKEALAGSEEAMVLPPYAIGSHRLNAQKVINSFAQKRIVCSVIRPSDDDDNDWITSLENLASSADILIIDWDIRDDNGENALNILEQINRSAIDSPAQLRLFVIYTGSPRIAEIVKKIKAELEDRLEVTIEEQDDGFSLTFNSTRIVVFAKPDTSNLPLEYDHRKVSFENLAERVTSEFAVMTAGLVSNVIIKSLALVRKNTYKMINKFSVHLDAPYLTHRSLQMNPEDAEDLLTALIGEELRAILEEGYIGGEANMEAIKDWISSLDDEQKLTLSLNNPVDFDRDKIIELLKVGITNWDGIQSKNQKEKVYKILTKMFQPESSSDKFLDEKFALLTTNRSYYEKRVPSLTLGTIIQKLTDKSYWVCIQPRCDCVRVPPNTAFLFLPLRVVEENKKFDVLLEADEKYINLILNKKPYDLNLITFTPGPNDKGVIVAKVENSGYRFTDTTDEKYKWIGELRPEHAQRIANEFAANLSRVGLDESEWLRLWATKG
jgi:hypothetical protein